MIPEAHKQVLDVYDEAINKLEKTPGDSGYAIIQKIADDAKAAAKVIDDNAKRKTSGADNADVPIVKVTLPGGGTIEAKIIKDGAGNQVAMVRQGDEGLWTRDDRVTGFLKSGLAKIVGSTGSTTAPVTGGNQEAADMLKKIREEIKNKK